MPLADSLRMVLAPPHRAGYPFLAGGGAAMLFGLFLGGWLFWPGALFTAFCLYFFRDPERVPPDRRGVILAPADGRVISVAPVIPPEELGLGERPLWRVAIFLSVLDVHVNRSPAAGRVVRIVYHPGKFLAAHLDKAAEENERNGMVIETWGGRLIGCVQIAGLIARRIVCDARVGQQLNAGERYGIIRFGSRTDLYLPEGVTPLVREGQTMIGGETVVADLTQP